MNRNAQRDETLRVAERAAEWLCVLEEGGAREQAAFAEWVSASPLHLKEFLFMSALESEAGRMDPERKLAVEEILARAQGNVVRLKNENPPAPVLFPQHGSRRTRRWTWAAAAAGVLAAVLAAWMLGTDGQTHQTAVGEQRRVELTDGSVIQLGTGSRVQISFSEAARDIRLLAGEALFKVKRDPSRPFRVHAGESVIQAVGTQFNVLRRPSGTTVSVVEGVVRVYAPAGEDSLSLGEQARIDASGRVEKRKVADVATLAAWRQDRLVFRDETLEDIAAEFNRYNRGLQIRLSAGELRHRRYTAVFDAGDPQSLIQFLREDDRLRVEHDGGEITIQPE